MIENTSSSGRLRFSCAAAVPVAAIVLGDSLRSSTQCPRKARRAPTVRIFGGPEEAFRVNGEKVWLVPAHGRYIEGLTRLVRVPGGRIGMSGLQALRFFQDVPSTRR